MLIALAGLVLIALTMIDALWTTLATNGGGPLTNGVSQGLWESALFIHRRRKSHLLLEMAGPVILMATMLLWVVLLWAGWTMLFSAAPDVVRHADTNAPATLAGRIYFTGYTLFTLGIGNYVPAPGGWEIATAIASFNGLFLITVAITYLVTVLSVVTQKRQLAGVISSLGRTPSEMLVRAWDGQSFGALSSYFADLTPQIEIHAQRHFSFPVLHYFHNTRRHAAASPSLAVLDEALLLVMQGAAPEARPSPAATEPLQNTIDTLLNVLQQRYFVRRQEPPPYPRLDSLRTAGIPTLDDEIFARAVAERADHRCLLKAFVEDDGWDWDAVIPPALAQQADEAGA